MKSEKLWLAVSYFALLGGCAIQKVDPPLDHIDGNPLSVVMPMDPDQQTFTAHFSDKFVPGTYKAQLDGEDITPAWVPPNPSALGASKWVYLDYFHDGACSKAPHYGGIEPEMICSHTLHLHGDSTQSTSPLATDVELSFIPVQLALVPKDSTGRYYSYDARIEIAPNQTMSVTLGAWTYGPWPQDNVVVVEALDWTERDAATFVSLNGQPAGIPLYLTISGKGTDFTVRALDNIGSGRWAFTLRARAIGCQEATYRYAVVHKL